MNGDNICDERLENLDLAFMSLEHHQLLYLINSISPDVQALTLGLMTVYPFMTMLHGVTFWVALNFLSILKNIFGVRFSHTSVLDNFPQLGFLNL
jgi:hypothetical protein